MAHTNKFFLLSIIFVCSILLISSQFLWAKLPTQKISINSSINSPIEIKEIIARSNYAFCNTFFYVSVFIKNSQSTLVENATMEIYLSKDAQIDKTDSLVLTNVISCSAGSIAHHGMQLLIPSNYLGDYHLLFRLKDPVAQSLAEKRLNIRILKESFPDLEIGKLKVLEDTIESLASLNISFDVSNIGLGISKPSQIRYYLKKDNTYENIVYRPIYVNDLYPNEFQHIFHGLAFVNNVTEAYGFWTPSKLEAGDYLIEVRIDSLPGENAANNILSIPIHLKPKEFSFTVKSSLSKNVIGKMEALDISTTIRHIPSSPLSAGRLDYGICTDTNGPVTELYIDRDPPRSYSYCIKIDELSEITKHLSLYDYSMFHPGKYYLVTTLCDFIPISMPVTSNERCTRTFVPFEILETTPLPDTLYTATSYYFQLPPLFLSTDSVLDIRDLPLNNSGGSFVIPESQADGEYYLITKDVKASSWSDTLIFFKRTILKNTKKIFITDLSASYRDQFFNLIDLSFNVSLKGNGPVNLSTAFYYSADTIWDVNDVYLYTNLEDYNYHSGKKEITVEYSPYKYKLDTMYVLAILNNAKVLDYAQVKEKDVFLGTFESEVWNDAYSIFPNPASEILNIVSSTKEQPNLVQIYSCTGNKVAEYKNFQNSIDISLLPKGMYILKIISDVSNISKKIVKN